MTYVRRKLRQDPWWHVAGLSFGLAFALLLMLARLYPGILNRVDQAVAAHIFPHQTLSAIQFFLSVTALGSIVGITAIALGAAYFLRHDRPGLIRFFLVLATSSLSMELAKLFVERARPEALLWLDPLNTYSFPSGHATLAAAFYGFLAVCAYRRAQGTIARTIAVAFPLALIALIGVSRIVLNVHYFTDVLAGTFLGLFWLAVAFMLPLRR